VCIGLGLAGCVQVEGRTMDGGGANGGSYAPQATAGSGLGGEAMQASTAGGRGLGVEAMRASTAGEGDKGGAMPPRNMVN
jgi:hypothetical protein